MIAILSVAILVLIAIESVLRKKFAEEKYVTRDWAGVEIMFFAIHSLQWITSFLFVPIMWKLFRLSGNEFLNPLPPFWIACGILSLFALVVMQLVLFVGASQKAPTRGILVLNAAIYVWVAICLLPIELHVFLKWFGQLPGSLGVIEWLFVFYLVAVVLLQIGAWIGDKKVSLHSVVGLVIPIPAAFLFAKLMFAS